MSAPVQVVDLSPNAIAAIADASNNSNGVSNRLALAATILAAGAFIVSFLQVLLEYLGSSEARNKVTYQAIGDSAYLVKFGWKWRFWKLSVKYPLLKFNHETLLMLAHREMSKGIDMGGSPMKPLGVKYDWLWSTMEEQDKVDFNSVA
jgi:hypothetical protein